MVSSNILRFAVAALAVLACLKLIASRIPSERASLPMCPMRVTLPYDSCRDPVNGLHIPDEPGKDSGSTWPATTTRWNGGAILVKASAPDPVPYDYRPEWVYGQILVRGKPLAGVMMRTTWHFGVGVRHCDSRADRWGVAACAELALQLSSADGDVIPVDVSFTYQGRIYSSHVSYIAEPD